MEALMLAADTVLGAELRRERERQRVTQEQRRRETKRKSEARAEVLRRKAEEKEDNMATIWRIVGELEGKIEIDYDAPLPPAHLMRAAAAIREKRVSAIIAAGLRKEANAPQTRVDERRQRSPPAPDRPRDSDKKKKTSRAEMHAKRAAENRERREREKAAMAAGLALCHHNVTRCRCIECGTRFCRHVNNVDDCRLCVLEKVK